MIIRTFIHKIWKRPSQIQHMQETVSLHIGTADFGHLKMCHCNFIMNSLRVYLLPVMHYYSEKMYHVSCGSSKIHVWFKTMQYRGYQYDPDYQMSEATLTDSSCTWQWPPQISGTETLFDYECGFLPSNTNYWRIWQQWKSSLEVCLAQIKITCTLIKLI